MRLDREAAIATEFGHGGVPEPQRTGGQSGIRMRFVCLTWNECFVEEVATASGESALSRVLRYSDPR
jgi:hypothetical protein